MFTFFTGCFTFGSLWKYCSAAEVKKSITTEISIVQNTTYSWFYIYRHFCDEYEIYAFMHNWTNIQKFVLR